MVAAGCFDAFSARLAQLAGFRAIHMTGLGVEASQLGAPDLGLMSMTEICGHAARMAEATNIPILADIDTGFGGVLNVGRTIREMERAGIAGVHIEDQALPKHCPLLAGRKVVGRGEAIDRLKAALDARTDPDFVIVARTDADTISFQEVIDRSNLFLEEGADMVMPVIMQVEGQSYFSLPADEQMEWARRMIVAIDGPVMNMGGSPPAGYTTDDLADAGYAFTMYAASALSAAANAMADLFKTIHETGSDRAYWARNGGPYTSPLELMRAARLDAFAAIEERYSASLGD
ncbi:isocitrate lyase/PEP mutase family protein [Flavisphingomonas formosensis]|uniref:isocitrate lyase/PEP mutase family protein n=1 Tax=Flavisphingomonas formosensis TaxID=861534 RepID=UPI0018DF5C9D|nr:isocitrate lyase/PEP mutase family protein [Sphingomonas formosensis]